MKYLKSAIISFPTHLISGINLNQELSSSRKIECGIRINPEYSEIETDIYNPCIIGSRLGTTANNFEENNLDGISGLHFHTMCEQNSDTLKRTIKVVDEKFGSYLQEMKWINFGGGHHITRDDYDIETLVECIIYFKNKYNLQVYLEPGEAIGLTQVIFSKCSRYCTKRYGYSNT